MRAAPWTAALTLVAAALLYVLLLARLRQLDQPEEARWWTGYSRDLVNLVALVLLTASFVLLEFPFHLALLAAILLELGAYTLDYLLARVLRLPRPALVLGAVLVTAAVIVVLARRPLADGLEGLLEALFSDGRARRAPG